MTDGIENSSHEFTNAQIKEMIEHQQERYDRQFTFLGANQDAFGEAAEMGMKPAGVAGFSMDEMCMAIAQTGNKVARMRSQSGAGEKVSNAFTDQERESMR